MPHNPLDDIKDFIDWLKKQEDVRHYEPTSLDETRMCSCPIARYLQEHWGYSEAQVGLRTWANNAYGFGTRSLPGWAESFVRRYDGCTYATTPKPPRSNKYALETAERISAELAVYR